MSEKTSFDGSDSEHENEKDIQEPAIDSEAEDETANKRYEELFESTKNVKLIATVSETEDYDFHRFWKSIKVGTVYDKPPGQAVESMTYTMLKLFLEREKPPKVLLYAVHLASHLLSPDDSKTKIFLQANFSHVTVVAVESPVLGIIEADGEVDELPEEKWKDTQESLLLKKLKEETYRKSVKIWGPALACLSLRSEKRTVSSILAKLEILYSTLSDLYSQNDQSCPVFDQTELLEKCPIAISNRPTVEILKNTLQLQFIMKYHYTVVTSQEKGILDFLSLQSLRYTGMTLVTLIDQLQIYYDCKLADLHNYHCQILSLSSWSHYVRYGKRFYFDQASELVFYNVEKDDNGVEQTYKYEDRVWKYAREFSGRVFSELSYMKSYYLCNRLAIHLDIIYEKDYTATGTGSIYMGIKSLRKNIPSVNEDYILYTKGVHEILEKQFKAKFGRKGAHEQYKEILEKQKKKDKSQELGIDHMEDILEKV